MIKTSTARAVHTPRRATQLIVWMVAAFALVGVTLMATGPETLAAVAAASSADAAPAITASTDVLNAAVSAPVASEAPQLLAASFGDGIGATSRMCRADGVASQYLPAMRWDDFSLFVYDNTFIFKLGSMMSFFAQSVFLLANVLWKILFWFLQLGVTFTPLCSSAKAVNTAVATLGQYAMWMFVPVAVFFLARSAKFVFKGRTSKAISSVLLMAIIFGGIFTITQTATKLKNSGASNTKVLSTVGSVPWMANQVVGAVSAASTSLTSLGTLTSSDAGGVGAFYDEGKVAKFRNDLTCRAYTEGLYTKFRGSSSTSSLAAPQLAMMEQTSRIWEQAYLSSWIRAQFGAGETGTNEIPSKVACRWLESTVDTSMSVKAGLFHELQGKSVMGWSKSQIVSSGLVGFMTPISDGARLPNAFAWAWCGYTKGSGWGVYPAFQGAERADDTLCANDGNAMSPGNSGKSRGLSQNEVIKDTVEAIMNKDTNVNMFDDGEGDVEGNIGLESVKLDEAREFARKTTGQGSGDRILQSVISLIVAAAFLWSLGPVSVGLVITSIALVILLALFPIMLFLVAIGNRGGPRLLKLTGAAAAMTFLFGLILSFLTLIISLLTGMATDVAGSGSSLLKQIILALIPLVALLLLKKALQALGLGNITSMTGALGMTSAMAAKAAGDNKLTGNITNGADRMGQKLSPAARAAERRRSRMDRAGEGSGLQDAVKNRMRLPGFAQKALDKAAPYREAAGSIMRDRAERLGSRMGDTFNQAGSSLKNKLASSKIAKYGTAVGQSAKAGVGGPLSAMLMNPTLARLAATGKSLSPLTAKEKLLAAGDTASRRIAQRAAAELTPADLRALNSDFTPAQLAGMGQSRDARRAMRNAQRHRTYMDRIKNPALRREAMDEYVGGSLDTARAYQHGALSPTGMNGAFAGFDSPITQEFAAKHLADQYGVDRNSLVIGAHGLAVPAPVERGANGAPKVPDGASLEFASNPALYLDKATSARVKGETDDQYAARITATLAARGLLDDQGRAVDVFHTVGVDITTQAGQQQVTRWLEGGTDVVLDKIVFNEVPGEARVIRSATEWSNRNVVDVIDRQWTAVQEGRTLHAEALHDITHLGEINVLDAKRGEGTTLTLSAAAKDFTGTTVNIETALRAFERGEASEEHALAALSKLGELDGASKSIAEGLSAASHARAAIAVSHYTTAKDGNVTPTELRQVSRTALERAEEEAGSREVTLDRQITTLYREARVARAAESPEERREAMRRIADELLTLKSTAQSYYQEEESAGADLADKLVREQEVVRIRRAQEETIRARSVAPSRKVIKSVTLVDALRDARMGLDDDPVGALEPQEPSPSL